MKTFFLTLFLTWCGFNTLTAQDRIFNYTYQSNVLNAGQREVEPWVTFKWGREKFYRAFENRIEYELGFAKNLQMAFYINAKTSAAQTNDSTIENATELSFSNEWKYKVFDAVADPVGFALYGEYGIGRNEIEIEGKLIFDKRIGNSILALNLVGELEFEKEAEHGEIENEKETVYELDLGYSYRVRNGLYLGIEARNHNEVVEGKWEHSALFMGPTLSYTMENFWVNLTILPQVKALKGATKNGLVLDEHERLETRLIFSYIF
ncbi:MAG TPA: hypothetical protein PLG25_01805 [bacterium]|nr:hypothetical protein [bacterium]HMY35314.1 hypothetical protein [bacterium]HMZ04743.1 hypothetical protein [bacterium]HNB08673.1 hypothetical protein [bacterium]HNB55628.1 hypothetical protein [bacterium]